MKRTTMAFLWLVFVAAPVVTAASSLIQEQQLLINADVIALTKDGLSPEIIIAKIKSSIAKFDTSAEALRELKSADVPDSVILAMIESSARQDKAPGTGRRRIRDDLTESFQRLQSSVVTVWSEIGHGTGFIIDKDGLVITNQHVVGPSEYIAVQFDPTLKIPATLLAASAEKDIAVLWVNLNALPDSTVAPIATTTQGSDPAVVEGERVLTVGKIGRAHV